MILTPQEQRMAIVDAVAIKYNLDVRRIMKDYRRKDITQARWEIFALIRAHFGDSYPKIGHFFDKDHASVIYGIGRYCAAMTGRRATRTACEEANMGMELFKEQLAEEARMYIEVADRIKTEARRNNPMYAHLMGDRHAA